MKSAGIVNTNGQSNYYSTCMNIVMNTPSIVENVTFSVSIGMECDTIKYLLNSPRYLHVKLHIVSMHFILPALLDARSGLFFCMCLNKLALCVYFLSHTLQDNLCLTESDCWG